MDVKAGKWLLALALFGSVFLVGLVDWITGPELHFFVFYFLPVSATAWYLGFRAAVSASILSACIWYLANGLADRHAAAHVYQLWNSGIRLIAFLYIGFAVAKMRQMLEKERSASAALRQALSEVKVLRDIIPICAECKKIRNDEGAWEQMEAYISERADTRFSHGYCPECAEKVRRDAGLGTKKKDTDAEPYADGPRM